MRSHTGAGVAICRSQSRHAPAALGLVVVLLRLSSTLCQHTHHAADHGFGGVQLDGEAAPPEERGSIYAAFPPVGGDGSAWQAVQSCTQAGGFVAMQQRMLGQTESFWPAITTAGRTDGQRVPWRVL